MGNKPTFDTSDAYWARLSALSDTETAGAITQPDASKRIAGWVTEKPPRTFFNWFWSRLARVVAWCVSSLVRRFADTEEAGWLDDSDTAVGDECVMRANARQALSTRDSATSASPTWNNPATDGRRIYLYGGTGGTRVRAQDMDDIGGTAMWDVEPDAAGAVQAIAADGLYVYTGHLAAATNEVYALDPVTGATVDSGTESNAVTSIAANGVRVCWVENDATGIMHTAPVGNFAGEATPVAHGAFVRDICVDGEYLFIVGKWDGSNRDVKCLDILTLATVWAITLATSDPAGTLRICTDGEFVYVSGIDDGSSNTLYCLNRTDGSVVWQNALGSTSATGIAVDDEYLYLADTDLLKINKALGVTVAIETVHQYPSRITASLNCVICDFEENGSTAGWIALWRGNGAGRRGMRRAATDKWRRPYHQLILPTE
jgi:hypothetical protein